MLLFFLISTETLPFTQLDKNIGISELFAGSGK